MAYTDWTTVSLDTDSGYELYCKYRTDLTHSATSSLIEFHTYVKYEHTATTNEFKPIETGIANSGYIPSVSYSVSGHSDITCITDNTYASDSESFTVTAYNVGDTVSDTRVIDSWTKDFTRTTTAQTVRFNIRCHGSVRGRPNGTVTGARTEVNINGSGTKGVSFTIPILPIYEITYDANGGSGAPGKQTKYHGVSINLQSGVPTRSGYKFMGWATSSTGSVAYNPGQVYTGNPTNGLTLYAVWHRNPTINKYSSSSSATQYQNATTYSVTYSSIILYDSATVSSVVLKIGSQTKSSTATSGTLSITPNTTGTFTPKLTITDSQGASSTYDVRSITVYENKAPTCTATCTSSGYYYGGYSTYSVNITNATAYNKKTIATNGIVLKVGTQTVARSNNGSLSLTLASVDSQTTKTVSVTITDNLGVSTPISLGSITVYPDTAPTATYTTSSGYYYGGVSSYTATVNVTTYNNKTLNNIKLTVGSLTPVTRTSNGTLSIALPTVSSDTTYAVSLEAIDSTGKKWTQSVGNITVYPNTAPVCSYNAPASTVYYYINPNVNSYQVTISSATAYKNKTISRIELVLGEQSTYITTTSGTLTIQPNTVLTAVVPTLKVIDNIGAFTTYNLPAVTVYQNTAPTATIQVTSSAPYYESTSSVPTAARTKYVIKVSNITVANNKTFKEAYIKLGNQTTSKQTTSGTLTFTIYPDTAGSNIVPSVIISDKINNTSTTGNTTTYTPTNNNSLANITVNSRSIAASNCSIRRIGSGFTLLNEGEYGLIQATFTYTKYTSNYLQQPTVTVTDDTASNLSASVTWYNGWDNTNAFTGKKQVDWASTTTDTTTYVKASSLTSPVTLYGKITGYTKNSSTLVFDKTKSYIITLTPHTVAEALSVSPVSFVMSQAFYLLAGRAGGHALGVGKKASADGMLDVGMQWIVMNQYDSHAPAIAYRKSGNADTRVEMISFVEDQTTHDVWLNFYNNKDVANRLISSLENASANWTDNTLIITSNTSGGTSTYYKRPASYAWNYIKSKLSGGDYSQSSFIIQDGTVDLTQANNGIRAKTERYFGVRDKNGNSYGSFDIIANTNGDTSVYMGVRNSSSGDSPTLTAWTGFSINKTKANSTSFSLGCGGTISGATTINSTLRVNNILTLYREGTTANNYPAGITFTNKDTTTGQSYSSVIYAYNDHATTTYGHNMVISPRGNMFIGSGESAENHYALYTSSTGENFFLTADGAVYIQANGNTIGNRLGFYINTAHQLLPCKAETATNNVGSIGNSSYRWASIYAGTINTSSTITATGAISSSSTITATGAISSSSTITATGNITAGNASQTAERDVIASSAAGRIYLYSAGSNTGNRGIYGSNAAGTGHAVITIGQNNVIHLPGGTTADGNLIASNGYVWSNGGLLYSTAYGNEVAIGSQNEGFCHIYNSASIPFAFNQGFAMVNNGNIGTTAYPTGNIIMKYQAKLMSMGSGGESISLIRMKGPDTMTLGAAAVQATEVYGDFYPALNGSKLGISGYRWSTIYATNGTINTSDKKDKDILGNITNAKDLILNLKPINYMWKDGDHRRIRMGFIAQDVATICKRLNKNLALIDAHYKDCENKPYYGEEVDDVLLHWGLNYKELVAPIVAVIQEQEQEIQQLKQQLSSIQQHLNLTE